VLNRQTIDVNKVVEVIARPILDFQHPGGDDEYCHQV
jgi:hypothetical protein